MLIVGLASPSSMSCADSLLNWGLGEHDLLDPDDFLEHDDILEQEIDDCLELTEEVLDLLVSKGDFSVS